MFLSIDELFPYNGAWPFLIHSMYFLCCPSVMHCSAAHLIFFAFYTRNVSAAGAELNSMYYWKLIALTKSCMFVIMKYSIQNFYSNYL